ncbi:MAG: tyrosine-type recombinase/integrase [Bacteroidetes bacterium]|nr:tyrosine-type recombinase/integrase [Bacteroidota bacterium]
MIDTIEEMENYTKLKPELDLLMRMRDKALIALSWIFFKRGGENLRVKLGDVYFNDNELLVTFTISKKSKREKVCPVCKDTNGGRTKFCKNCGQDLILVKVERSGSNLVVTKGKSTDYKFCTFVMDWTLKLRDMGGSAKDALFPRYTHFGGFQYDKSIKTVQRLDQILQKIDPIMTSHMFRYGAAEKFLRLGYTPYDLKEIGDWATTQMPELYAKRQGLTQTQKRFSQDTRVT